MDSNVQGLFQLQGCKEGIATLNQNSKAFQVKVKGARSKFLIKGGLIDDGVHGWGKLLEWS